MRSPCTSLVAAALGLAASACGFFPVDDQQGAAALVDGGTTPGATGADAGAADAGAVTAQVLGFSGVGNLSRDPAQNQAFLTAMGYANEAAYGADVIAKMQALASPMGRGHFYYLGRGQFATEPAVAWMEAAGFDVYGWVNPIPPVERLDPEFDAAFAALIAAHPRIKHWQLGNEPDLAWQDKAAFPAFFLRAQRVVRASCADCKVLLAGISNQYDTASTNFQAFEGFVRDIVAGGPTGRAFDVFDLHYYKERPSRDELTGAVASARAMLARHGLDGVALWCTETGLYTGAPAGPMAPRTELDQARDLPKLVGWMAAAGVERVYNWTIVEAYTTQGAPGFFDGMGLVYNGLGGEAARGVRGGTKKPAFTTWALLAAALRDVRGARELSPGVVRAETAAGPVFLAWSDTGAARVTLEGLGADAARVQPLVPDAQGQALATTVSAPGGVLALDVDAAPRLVTPLR